MALRRELDIRFHLERVSRSFAFCIARLDEPLRHQVGLAYLLCRILDTNEDAKWSDVDGQKASFDAFIQLLLNFNGAKSWSENLLANATEISPREMSLVEDADLVVDAVAALSKATRDVMLPPIISMAQGMRGFAFTRNRNQGRLTLHSLDEVDRYCFFVAGVVGEILDGLLRIEAENSGVSVSTRLRDGFRFGLFLQKVNLLKDRETDLLEGRDLVPDVAEVFASCLRDAEQGFAYVRAIPDAFLSYRLFCAWSLFLGLASLKHIARGERIGRLETLALIANVEFRIDAIASLEALFRQSTEAVYEVMPKRNRNSIKHVANSEAEKGLEKEWLARYRRDYVGSATDEELIDLIDLVDLDSR